MNRYREIYVKIRSGLDRFFKTDSDYLIRSGAWGIFSDAAVAILLFGLSLLYARILSKDAYGSYRYVMSILSIGGFLLLPGIHTSFKRLAARGYEGSYRKDIKYRLLASFLLGLFGIGAGICFILFRNDLVIGIGVIIAGILIPLERGTGSYIDWFAIKQKFRRKAFSSIIEHIFFFAVMALSLLYIRESTPSVVEIMVILVSAFYLGHGIPKTTYLLRILKEIPEIENKEKEKEAFRYGLHLSAGSIIPTIANNVDKVLIYAYLGPVSLAIYSFATVLPDQIRGFITSFDSAVVTKIFAKKSSDLDKLPTKLLRASLAVFLIVILYIIAAPFIYKTFFPRYIDSVVFSQIYSVGLIFLSFIYLNSAMVAKGHIKRVYAHRGSVSLLQIVLLAILVPALGIMGAVLSRVVIRFIESIILYSLFKIK